MAELLGTFLAIGIITSLVEYFYTDDASPQLLFWVIVGAFALAYIITVNNP